MSEEEEVIIHLEIRSGTTLQFWNQHWRQSHNQRIVWSSTVQFGGNFARLIPPRFLIKFDKTSRTGDMFQLSIGWLTVHLTIFQITLVFLHQSINHDIEVVWSNFKKNIAKGTTDPGVNCFNQSACSAYSAPFAYFAYFAILHIQAVASFGSFYKLWQLLQTVDSVDSC